MVIETWMRKLRTSGKGGHVCAHAVCFQACVRSVMNNGPGETSKQQIILKSLMALDRQ